jgi:hypothetical protein
MTCGCMQPGNDHGDPRNITLDRFIEAAEVAGITLDECIKNVEETYEGESPGEADSK